MQIPGVPPSHVPPSRQALTPQPTPNVVAPGCSQELAPSFLPPCARPSVRASGAGTPRPSEAGGPAHGGGEEPSSSGRGLLTQLGDGSRFVAVEVRRCPDTYAHIRCGRAVLEGLRVGAQVGRCPRVVGVSLM